MRAFAVIPDRRTTVFAEAPEPQLQSPTSVKLAILDVGVCGTDREIVAFEYGTPPDGEDHLILGHEALGRVLEVGEHVDVLAPGDLVIPSVRRPCPHDYCVACRSDQQDFCYTGDFTERGIKEQHGFMTERIVDDVRYMTPLPSELRDVGVLVEPLTIAEKALAQIWRVQQRLPWACSIDSGSLPSQGCTALVLGAGPVGLLGGMALTESGFHTHVYSRGPEGSPPSQIVKAFGGEYISSEAFPVDGLPDRLNGIDVVYEATGASSLAFEVLQVLGTNGVFVFTGVPGRKHRVEVDTNTIMRNLVLKNQVVFGTVNAGRDAFQSAIERLGRLMQRWPDAVQALITKRWPLDKIQPLLTTRTPGIKHVVEIGDE
jgi:threonine dehydrogenase-like Zn-dependent dehydrogenase